METALAQLGQGPLPNKRIFNRLPQATARSNEIEVASLNYLYGRQGNETADLLAAAQSGDMERIEPLSNVWAELRWAAREEGVLHLSDLLLRRCASACCCPTVRKHRCHASVPSFRQKWAGTTLVGIKKKPTTEKRGKNITARSQVDRLSAIRFTAIKTR